MRNARRDILHHTSPRRLRVSIPSPPPPLPSTSATHRPRPSLHSANQGSLSSVQLWTLPSIGDSLNYLFGAKFEKPANAETDLYQLLLRAETASRVVILYAVASVPCLYYGTPLQVLGH